MLKFLNITNFAVIQRLSFDLHEGLNLLTGETGAGKSIIVDALGLLLGGRATAGVVRTGERAALVEGQFELGGASEQRVRAALAEIGIEKAPEEDLWIRREVQTGGRGRIFINDQSVTASTLRRLQPSLLEIHGQGEQQALSAARTHLEMLDNFAGCADLRGSVARAYARYRVAFEALRSLERDEAARERASDMLRFQIEEIEKASPSPSEDEELAAERRLLAHAERALELSAGAYAALYESDESVLSKLSTVRRRLQELSAIDGRVGVWLEGLEAATLSLTDVAEALRGYGADVDFSPGRLSEVENRLVELERLKRKYGRDLQGLLEVKEDLKRQLQQMGNLAERERELLEEVEAASEEYAPLAESLTARRIEAAPRLEARMTEELRHVALERARFVVSIETATRGIRETPVAEQNRLVSDNEKEVNDQTFSFWSPSGADRVEFLFSANIGESVRPLSRVASGGELSRLMLTLRTVCRNAQTKKGESEEEVESASAALIFDEIDTGIGGRVAEAVGRRLKALAATRQVLCVTHQAQIARFADHHYVVSKRVEDDRTVTSVRELSREERVGELARMIGGAETIETARQTALWMLEQPSAQETASTPDAESSKTRIFTKKGAQKQGRGAGKGKGSRLARENSATLAKRKEGLRKV